MSLAATSPLEGANLIHLPPPFNDNNRLLFHPQTLLSSPERGTGARKDPSRAVKEQKLAKVNTDDIVIHCAIHPKPTQGDAHVSGATWRPRPRASPKWPI